MKNLNDIENVDNNNSTQTLLSIKSSHVTTHHVMKKVTTQTVTSSSSSSNDVTDGENNIPFIFSSSMYQTMPARHSSARSRDKDKEEELNGNMNLNHHHHHTLPAKKRNVNGSDKFEIPLPFGYHLDLDFLRFCTEELVSGETLERLQELRQQRRQQRKTLEALMGLKQKQREDKLKEIGPQKSIEVKRSFSPKRPQPPTSLPLLEKSSLTIEHSKKVLQQENTHEFITEALREAVSDFENYLDTSKEKNERPMYRSAARAQRFKHYHSKTLPSTHAVSSPDEPMPSRTFDSRNNNLGRFCFHQSSTSSLCSSISTTSSACLYPLPNYSSSEAVLAELPSSVPIRLAAECMETDSNVSLNSEMSTNTLRNIREHIAKSLTKLKEYEKQVEAIPVLQVKLSVLKEEKRLLMLKLKQRELQIQREHEAAAANQDVDSDPDFDTESELEDLNGIEKTRQNYSELAKHRKRSRSESPYAKMLIAAVAARKRSASTCECHSDDLERREQPPSRVRSELNIYTRNFKQQQQKQPLPEQEIVIKTKVEKVDSACNTDPMVVEERIVEIQVERAVQKVETKNVSVNTNPPPVPPKKSAQGTNTVSTVTDSRSTSPIISMDLLVTRDEMEARVQEAIFRTEEEIMGCPLLQRAMAKVEHEALYGVPLEPAECHRPMVETADAESQVGHDNLAPFVISVGLQCKFEDEPKPFLCSQCKCDNENGPPKKSSPRPASNTIGVGDCKVIEDPPDPKRFREIGVCTEKWVEVIKASKQTDTEDFAFKDTESPRVADMVFEQQPTPEKVLLRRTSSLKKMSSGSPTSSRRSSANSPLTIRKSSSSTQTNGRKSSSQSTMTDGQVKKVVPTKDANVGCTQVEMKSVGTTALTLSLENKHLPAPGSPLSTPDTEKPAVRLNLCDKCNHDIKEVAAGIIAGPQPQNQRVHAPPSPDLPWLSKIPRPVVENPDVNRLKAATSTGNLFFESQSKSQQIAMQRSKSNLTPTMGRRLMSPRTLSTGPLSPSLSYRNIGTPPPHPNVSSTISNSSKRVQSPLALSQTTSKDKKSLIPKLSPQFERKATSAKSSQASSGLVSPVVETRSFIPRVVTPPVLRKMYPKASDGGDKLATPDRNVVRKNTYTKLLTGVNNPDLDKDKKATELVKVEEEKKKEEVVTKEPESNKPAKSAIPSMFTSKGGFPLPGAALFTPIDENRRKAEPSREMRAALKVLNDSFAHNSGRSSAQITSAVNIIQQEWFKTSSTKQSNPLDVEDYLDAIEEMSKGLLDRVVNLTDVNGNTALHYSVSHGNFDVVSILLDSKVANTNILNKAGYTCIMLISLAPILNETHRAVVCRLFSLGDVNVRATQHGQTALMLAASHGRLDMVQLLVEAGADVNIRDEDGSTALMCSAEHGHAHIVKYLLQNPETDVLAKDNDGLTALAVAMEAGHRDLGVLLYANTSLSRGASPYSSVRVKRPQSSSTSHSRTASPSSRIPSRTSSIPVPSSSTPKAPTTPTPPQRTRRNSLNQ